MRITTPLAAPSPERSLSSTYVRRPARGKRNLFLRIVDAIANANRLKAEREIARYITRNGGQLTDRMEREIGQRFGER